MNKYSNFTTRFNRAAAYAKEQMEQRQLEKELMHSIDFPVQRPNSKDIEVARKLQLSMTR